MSAWTWRGRAVPGCLGLWLLLAGGVQAVKAQAQAQAQAPVPAASLVQLVKQSKPAVVLVGTFAATDSPRFQFRGTGFVVGDGRTVVTNAHVLPEELGGLRAEAPDSPAQAPADPLTPSLLPPPAASLPRRMQVQVWTPAASSSEAPSGHWTPREAEVLRIDKATDLALLRLQGPPLAPLLLGEKAWADEGQDIALLGFPIGGALGFSHVVHRGVLAAVTPLMPPQARARDVNAAAVRQAREPALTIYQLDATAFPGNSGGPVFELATGRVIGVVNRVLTKAGREGALSQPSGISYAIPVAYVHALLVRR